MIELHQIVEAVKQDELSTLPLELITPLNNSTEEISQTHRIKVPKLTSWRSTAAYYLRRLLRLHTIEQKEAAKIFIDAMHRAHPNSVAIDHILRSEKIRVSKPITAKQALHAYQKFVLLEQTIYQFIDDGSNTNHRELRFMHGLVMKLKTFFR